ncbi:protein YbjH [Escherichia albertii]|uniref:protein YbjH n=1 Tax=Escherichia albertii TaxID=208962 RepID=UPI00237A6FAD|nr:protein YbjH [Escherichia albertii]MDD9747829.1 protein YbjH [Escherichia albertii]
MIMKNCLLLGVFLLSFTGAAMAQSVTVDVPGGYKVVVVPDSVNVPQAVSVTTVPQTVYVAPMPAPAYRPHPYVRHLASVGEGMVIEHQIDDHHH